jgi:hypothetical protein
VLLRRLAAIAALAWTYAAAAALDGRRTFPAVRAGDWPSNTPPVSVIVPARDEERDLGAALASLTALHWPQLEIVVVDDESRDATWDVIAAAAAADPRVRAIRGAPLPHRWVGKQWALWQGVQAATGDWLLFADADVRHAPASLGAALALAERTGAAGVSLAPLIEVDTAAARTLTGAALGSLLAFVAPPFAIRHPRLPVALAAGGHILVRRHVYDAVGGHAAVADRMIDDVALAEVLKRAGHPLLLATADGLVRVRMYRTLAEAIAGWRKSAAHGVRGHRLLAAAGGAFLVVGGGGPVLALLAGARRRDRRLAAAGAAGWAAAAAMRLTGRRLCPGPAVEALAAPAGIVGLGAVVVRSALDRRRGGPIWRGRRYPFAR